MSLARLISVLVITTLLSHALHAAEQWDRFRGPNGTGVVTAADIPLTWQEQDLAWKTTLPAKGHSSPVIWDSHLYVTCAEKETGKRMVVCLDTNTGKVLWEQDGQGATFRQHADNSFASGTPAVDDKHVYVAWFTPEGSALIAYTHEGKQSWTVDLGNFVAQHGAGTSPIVVGDLVIITCEQDQPGSYVLAVDAATGKQRWKLERKSERAPCSTPCLVDDGKQPPYLVFSSTANGLYAVDVKNGAVLWDISDAFKQRCVASPVYSNGVIVANDGQGGKGVRMIGVKPPTEVGGKAEIIWSLKTGIPYVPCPLGKDDMLFLVTDSGLGVCLDVMTGKEIWRKPLGVGTFYGSPVRVADHIYVISKRGEVVCFAADRTFNLFGVSPLGDGSFATPAFSGNRMYLRTFTSVVAVGKK